MSHELDGIDRRILNDLQRDARLTTAALAERVGLSSTPCWRRVKRLEEEGFILGYVALLDPKKIGFPDSVIAQVTLEKHRNVDLDRFVGEVLNIPRVQEAYLVAGEGDYWLRVAVAGSEDYERLLTQQLLRIEGVTNVRSVYILKQVKFTTEYPVEGP